MPAPGYTMLLGAGAHDGSGFETEIAQGGMNVSGGQKQRIALARAFFGEPSLIVLDEPNSNLDSLGDQALTQAILAVRRRGGIVVVVAHRPALVAVADEVIELLPPRADQAVPA